MVDRVFADRRLAALYDLLAPWGEADDRFYLPLVMAASSVLDVGCGTGQLLIAAREAGHDGRLCGLDPAQAMLDQARARSDVIWILGDLSNVSVPWTFDLIVMTGHAFQVFVTDDQLRAALAAIRDALAPDGRFAFETRNPAARAWDSWTPDYVTEITTPTGSSARFSRNAEPPDGDLVRFTSTFTSSDWDGPRFSHSTLRFLDAGSLSSFLADAGLTIVEQFGDWDRATLSAASPEIITIARRS
ncbi:MAG TPA: methyltransferase domain-containing protein [Thermomicrobiales bacterium]|nr:methyltransferase domain-containing protein [Thermomicrobiales bacterium]